jgi:hypothetical protein
MNILNEKVALVTGSRRSNRSGGQTTVNAIALDGELDVRLGPKQNESHINKGLATLARSAKLIGRDKIGRSR